MRSRRSGRALLACATSLARRRSRMSPASMQAPAPRTTHRVAEFLGGPLTFVARTGNCRRVAVADACRCRAVCRVHSQSTFSFSEHTFSEHILILRAHVAQVREGINTLIAPHTRSQIPRLPSSSQEAIALTTGSKTPGEPGQPRARDNLTSLHLSGAPLAGLLPVVM